MRRVFITCLLLITLVKGECSDDENDIKKLKDILIESNVYIKKHSVKDNAAIIIGQARVGKSTLLNYLINNKLMSEKIGKFTPISLIRAENKSEGPDIGGGGISKTKIPQKFTSSKFPHLSLWDTPGFDDNRGCVQDISNTFYIYQLIKNVDYLKVVLLLDYSDIASGTDTYFHKGINNLENLLGSSYQQFFPSVTVIFSKAPNIENLDYMSAVKLYITERILPEKTELKLNNFTVNFLEFLVNNTDRIGFFKRAPNVGKIITANDIDVNIIPAIRKSKRVLRRCLLDLNLSISDSSKIWLYKFFDKLVLEVDFVALTEKIIEIVKKQSEAVKESFKGRDSTKLKNLKRTLEGIYSIFQKVYTESNFEENIKLFKDVDHSINEFIESNQMLSKIDCIMFIDKLLGKETNRQILTALHSVIDAAKNYMKAYVCKIGNELDNTSNNCIGEFQESKKRSKRNLKERMHDIEKLSNNGSITNLWSIIKNGTDDINKIEL